MTLAPLLTVTLDCTRPVSSFLIVILLVVASRMDEVSLGAWIVGGGFITLETYFFASLLWAWRRDRRAFREMREIGGQD